MKSFSVLGCVRVGYASYGLDWDDAGTRSQESAETGTFGASLELRYTLSKHWHLGVETFYDVSSSELFEAIPESQWGGSFGAHFNLGFHF
jgi:hypothetical protein